jgi:lauroyl/myristoyl acyltransferase
LARNDNDRAAAPTNARRGRRPFRYRLETAGLALASAVIPRLPRGVAMAFGRLLGWLAWALLAHDRKVAHANLDVAFGDGMSLREKRRIVRGTFQNAACNMVGLFWGPRITAANVRDYVDVDESNRGWFQQMQDRRKGIIFITPHYGDWELLNLAAGYLGAPYTCVMEPAKNPAVSRTVARLRSMSGHTPVEPRFAVIKLFKAVTRGETVGIVVDTNARRGRGGVWLDFFGLKVFSTAAVAQLARRTGAVIIFAAAHPLPGRRIRLQFGPEIPLDDTGDEERDVLTTSQRCLDQCANLIRANPDPWLWTYKRWKRRPTPERGRYPFYSKFDPNT